MRWMRSLLPLAFAGLLALPGFALAQPTGGPAGMDEPGAAAPAAAGEGDEKAADAAAPEAPPPAADTKAAPKEEKKGALEKMAPILILLVVVGIVLARLPRIEEVTHSDAFRRRRVLNWLPLGLTYALLYMSRYNLKVSQHAFDAVRGADGDPIMTNAAFGIIFGVGTAVYGASFLLNGPLTDRYGGKKAILVGAGGAMVMNALMGLSAWHIIFDGSLKSFLVPNFVTVFAVLYGANMYFQSFGAVAIVKVNAPWFHVRERGVFGAIFGILISLGIYFAYDVGYMILEMGDTAGTKPENLPALFLIPAGLLAIFLSIDIFTVQNTPAEAGLTDFDTADASSGDDGPQLGAVAVFKKMFSNPVIVTIAFIEFCSGFLRQAIMQWYRTFAKQTDGALGLKTDFVYENWGMLLCCAGILGGLVAGVISDRVFQSRRGPVAAVLYGVMLAGSIFLVFTYDQSYVGWTVVVMSMAVIGVHGMLSGTASMDFGGKKNVGVAVGIIDGFVYAGTAFMSIVYGFMLPEEHLDEAGKLVGPATDPTNWLLWPVAMIPMAAIGLILATRVWNAKPQGKKA